MKKTLFLALLALSCQVSAVCMPDYDVGDDLHKGGDYIDLDEGFDYQSGTNW